MLNINHKRKTAANACMVGVNLSGLGISRPQMLPATKGIMMRIIWVTATKSTRRIHKAESTGVTRRVNEGIKGMT